MALGIVMTVRGGLRKRNRSNVGVGWKERGLRLNLVCGTKILGSWVGGFWGKGLGGWRVHLGCCGVGWG